MKITHIVVFLMTVAFLGAQDIKLEIQLASLPQNVEQLIVARADLGRHPSGAAVLFITGLMKYAENPAVGGPMLISMLTNDGSQMVSSSAPGSYRGFTFSRDNKYLLDRLAPMAYVPNTYVAGTQQANGYALPSGPYVFEFQPNPRSVISETEVRIYVKCTGGVMPRPIRLKLNSEGIWKVSEFSSLVVGISNLPPSGERDEL